MIMNSTAGMQVRPEPIALIGMSCRLPGAGSVGEFWNLMMSQGNTITEIPASRFDATAEYSLDPSRKIRLSSTRGGVLDQVEYFDADFFASRPGTQPEWIRSTASSWRPVGRRSKTPASQRSNWRAVTQACSPDV
jgi:hypothetical protein